MGWLIYPDTPACIRDEIARLCTWNSEKGRGFPVLISPRDRSGMRRFALNLPPVGWTPGATLPDISRPMPLATIPSPRCS